MIRQRLVTRMQPDESQHSMANLVTIPPPMWCAMAVIVQHIESRAVPRTRSSGRFIPGQLFCHPGLCRLVRHLHRATRTVRRSVGSTDTDYGVFQIHPSKTANKASTTGGVTAVAFHFIRLKYNRYIMAIIELVSVCIASGRLVQDSWRMHSFRCGDEHARLLTIRLQRLIQRSGHHTLSRSSARRAIDVTRSANCHVIESIMACFCSSSEVASSSCVLVASSSAVTASSVVLHYSIPTERRRTGAGCYASHAGKRCAAGLRARCRKLPLQFRNTMSC